MRDLAVASLAGLALAACDTSHKPEADPVRLVPIMKTMDKNTPAPGDVPDCTADQLSGGATLTHVTLLKISGEPAGPGPERADWLNPPELDSRAARQLADAHLDDTTHRQAAYELLSAPFFLLYQIDLVDTPAAEDAKRGTVNVRAVRFDREGNSVCLKALALQNTRDKTDWTILKGDLAAIDPKVSTALRDDLRDQLLAHIRALGRRD